MRSRVEMGVRINLAGREPAGVVPPDEYEWVRGELISMLEGVRTPAGEPAFEAVYPREEVFDGPYVEAAADVVVVPAGFDQYLSASLLGAEFGPPSEPYNHKLYGVLAAGGEGVDWTADLDGAHLLDVAPTVLASLGVPHSDRMDGEVLPVVEPAGSESYPAFEPEPTQETDDEAIEQRLSDLGYLE